MYALSIKKKRSILNPFESGPLSLVLAFASILTLVLLTPRMPTMTNAQGSVRRSAPVVWLSNRMEVRLTTRLNDDPSDIRSIPHVLRVPVGVKVIKIAYTERSLRRLESLTVIADNPAGRYTSDAVVHAGRVHLTVVDEETARTSRAAAGGTANRHLLSRIQA